MLRLAVLVLLCPGCYSPVSELVAPHTEAGGTLTAMLDAGPAFTTVAIANASAQPMTLEGTSPSLVYGLIFGIDDLTGMPAHDQVMAGHEVRMTVSSTGTVQMSVHAGGRSCAANAAAIHLVPDGNGHLNGDFTGLGDACQMSGTFSGIPIYTE